MGWGRERKQRTAAMGLSGTQASTENSARREGGKREPERVVTQPGLGVFARSGFLPFCKCARLIENDLMFVTKSLLNLKKQKKKLFTPCCTAIPKCIVQKHFYTSCFVPKQAYSKLGFIFKARFFFCLIQYMSEFRKWLEFWRHSPEAKRNC